MSHTTPEALLAALDAAADDTARTALLNAAPRALREQFRAMLVYRQLNADVEAKVAAQEAACKTFTRSLDAATDDAARLALIGAADPAFVADWAWRRTATADDWRRRYLALAGGSEEGHAE